MIRSIVCLVLFIGAQAAIAGTDYQCMSDCAKAGYGYSYCKRICAY